MGFNDAEETVGPLAGKMVSEACCELLPSLAVITAVVLAETDVVVMVNEALVLPAATVTLAGTLAAALLLESDTTVSRPGSMSWALLSNRARRLCASLRRHRRSLKLLSDSRLLWQCDSGVSG